MFIGVSTEKESFSHTKKTRTTEDKQTNKLGIGHLISAAVARHLGKREGSEIERSRRDARAMLVK